MVQLEIEPDGVARIYRESTCQIDTEDALTWVEEEDGSSSAAFAARSVLMSVTAADWARRPSDVLASIEARSRGPWTR